MTEVLSLLVLLSIIAALIALHTPNLLHAVIAVGAVGLLLAVMFVLLAAPDLAIVQIGVRRIGAEHAIQAERQVQIAEVGVAFVAVQPVEPIFAPRVDHELAHGRALHP